MTNLKTLSLMTPRNWVIFRYINEFFPEREKEGILANNLLSGEDENNRIV
ncbi:MAG: hypothetical protein HYX67_08370 [Candidatus Melainabacteria bacterium]|nr:hypothetical protein [Candidatus Melainabacteria bacterium]